MSCDCYTIGGPFIAEDPDCFEHGTAAKDRDVEAELAIAELNEKILVLTPKWTNTTDELPKPGLIVKRWKSGAVWAGYYSGSTKDTSFDSWISLPV